MNKVMERVYAEADVVIQYRMVKSFMNASASALLAELEARLIQNDKVQKRFEYLNSKEKLHDSNGIHGSTSKHLENALPMLLDFGFYRGIRLFDDAMQSIMNRIQKYEHCEKTLNTEFMKIIIYPFISQAGYATESIETYMWQRLDTLHAFTSKKNYDLYDASPYSGIPKNFSNRRVLKPELYKDNIISFPLIYDLNLLVVLSKNADSETQEKIDTVIRYLLEDAYDAIDEGYGLLVTGPRRYLAMGWDAKLPLSHNGELTSRMLHTLELMSHFKVAIHHNWFKQVYALCETYKDEQGMYHFPKETMIDRESNWIYGNHLSYGENRRKKEALVLESTFKMICIQKNMEINR